MNVNIGIFDSGIGGLTVLSALKKSLPYGKYIYVADERNFPYGDKTKQQLLSYSKKIIEYLIKKNVKIIIIACNTISSTVLKDIEKLYPTSKIIGVVKPTIKSVLENTNKNILLLATPNTIKSNIYKKEIEKASTNKVYNIKAPALAQLIETRSDRIKPLLSSYLSKYNNIDIIILGCTHYKLIEPTIRELSPAQIISSSDSIINEVKEYLTKLEAKNEEQKTEIYTTGDVEKFRKLCFNICKENIKHLDL